MEMQKGPIWGLPEQTVMGEPIRLFAGRFGWYWTPMNIHDGYLDFFGPFWNPYECTLNAKKVIGELLGSM